MWILKKSEFLELTCMSRFYGLWISSLKSALKGDENSLGEFILKVLV